MADTNNTTNVVKAPTTAEAMFFFAIVKHTKNKADINWEGVASEQGLKNAEVAKVRFGQIRRKLGINPDTSPRKGSAAGAEPSPRKPKAATAGVRKPRGGGKKTAKPKKEDGGDNGENGVKKEYNDEDYNQAIKQEQMNADAQLQADMDAMVNEDPF